MYIDTNKATIINKCTSSAGHFDGHGSALEQYRQYCSMPHVQGYSGSHWTLPWGNYSLHIAPVATPGQQANKQQSTNAPKKVAILMATVVRRYNTVCIAQ